VQKCRLEWRPGRRSFGENAHLSGVSHGFPIAIVPDSPLGVEALTAPYVITGILVRQARRAGQRARKVYGLKEDDDARLEFTSTPPSRW